ncbi:hypothetical protein [Heyndrickxia acidiproducens]|jgi:hypothetical protein|uniref:hypothetical protein n=1 Tax=Heyndrickxia acidiproducens TaxID=1121084 RepID=UPI000373F993|nr:hypothetical protein [Heyndrickxia acidiproducens]
MDILIAVLVEAAKTSVNQTIVLVFHKLSTKRKKKTTRYASNKSGRSSKKK